MRPTKVPWMRVVTLTVATSSIAAISGCQSYEPLPLNLAEHRFAMDSRLLESGSLAAFAKRLRESGAQAPDQFDMSDGISAAEGEVLALFYNPDLRLARAEAGIALANFETAGLWSDPEFGFDGAELISPDGAFEFGLTLGFTIPVSGRLSLERDHAGAAYETELRRIVDAEWATRHKVRLSWAAWTTALERARLLREVAEHIERIILVTDPLRDAGELSGVEGRLFPIELAQRQAALILAELDTRKAMNELLGLMGFPTSLTTALIPSLEESDHSMDHDPFDTLIQWNTALSVKRAAYQAEEEALRLEIRKQYPDITIGPGYGSENHDDRLLLGLSLPIPILNGNRAGIAEAKARRDVARVDAEATFERLAIELTTSIAKLNAAKAQREHFESDIVPMVTEQAEEAEKTAALGAVDPLLLLNTVTLQFETKSRLLDIRLAEIEGALEISELLGMRMNETVTGGDETGRLREDSMPAHSRGE